MSEEAREVKTGGCVTFVDERGHEHAALVTAVWGAADSNPSINLAYVDPHEGAKDAYGSQIVRASSVVHESSQGAHGNYWK